MVEPTVLPARPRSAPTVSVVMATYNAASFVEEALGSVLRQTFTDLEVVVVDDGSSDGTLERVRGIAAAEPRVRVLAGERNIGGYGAMNRGAAEAIGRYLAFYHADDRYDPTIVEREVARFSADATLGAVFCLDRFIDEDGREYRRLAVPPDLAQADRVDLPTLTEAMLRHKNTFLRTPSVMFRADVFRQLGGWDQAGWGIQADVDMWLRLVAGGHAIGIVREHLYDYRHYEQQWSRVYARLRTDTELYFDIMDRHLSQPGVRDRVSGQAVMRHRIWRVQDEAECAANALVLGDRRLALAILRGSLVRPLLRSPWPGRVLRVLGLRAIVAAAAAAGGGPVARTLVHVARFRRLLPRRAQAAPTDAHQRLGGASAHSPRASRADRDRRAVTVYLDPFTTHFYGNGLFNPRSKLNRDDCLRPWRLVRDWVRERGVEMVTADYLDDAVGPGGAKVYVSFGVRDRLSALAKRPDVLLNSFYLFEVVILEPEMYRAIPRLQERFRTVYSWSDAETLAPFVGSAVRVLPFRIPMPRESVVEPLWNRTDRAGTVMISGNRTGKVPDGELYSARLEALRDFGSSAEPIDLWGQRWEQGLGPLDAEFGTAMRHAFRGPTADKYETLSRYRFAVCYENMALRGWVTEKLFDCLAAGTVPIYLGAPEIRDLVPAECFIDRRDFRDVPALVDYLRGLTPDDVARYREAGRAFFDSAAAAPFTAQAFAERLLRDVGGQLAEVGIDRPWE